MSKELPSIFHVHLFLFNQGHSQGWRRRWPPAPFHSLLRPANIRECVLQLWNVRIYRLNIKVRPPVGIILATRLYSLQIPDATEDTFHISHPCVIYLILDRHNPLNPLTLRKYIVERSIRFPSWGKQVNTIVTFLTRPTRSPKLIYIARKFFNTIWYQLVPDVCGEVGSFVKEWQASALWSRSWRLHRCFVIQSKNTDESIDFWDSMPRWLMYDSCIHLFLRLLLNYFRIAFTNVHDK